jgi:F-type H+-transporting ATPase subunit gamma
MANLRDIKTRIGSVKTTRQVTSAMKMVSAARLKKAQDNISHIRPYTGKMAGIMAHLAASLDKPVAFDYSVPQKNGQTLILVIASNRGLCGGFNANVVKAVQSLIFGDLMQEYKSGKIAISILGRQAEKMFKSRNIQVDETHHDLIQTASFSEISNFADKLMQQFNAGVYSKVIVVYNEFVNAAVQSVQSYQYLPFEIAIPEEDQMESSYYIYEPDPLTIIHSLVPDMLHAMLFQIVLESQASEHGARMTSMHKATDNATDLIKELQLGYNKARQTAITNQIVEITGGAEALNKG